MIAHGNGPAAIGHAVVQQQPGGSWYVTGPDEHRDGPYMEEDEALYRAFDSVAEFDHWVVRVLDPAGRCRKTHTA
jgi:hypothetical protein